MRSIFKPRLQKIRCKCYDTGLDRLKRSSPNTFQDEAHAVAARARAQSFDVLAPMPSAMEMMASDAKPGFLTSWRKPNRISWRSVSIGTEHRHYVDATRTQFGFRKFRPAEIGGVVESRPLKAVESRYAQR